MPLSTARHALDKVSDRLITLSKITEGVETTLVADLQALTEISSKSIRTLQDIDYLRQALEDASAIVRGIAEQVDWQDGATPTLECLTKDTKLDDTRLHFIEGTKIEMQRKSGDLGDFDLF